jgi:hypothetical protein
MGAFQKEVKEAKELIDELQTLKSNISKEDFILKKNESFKKIYKLIQSQIKNEIEDEKILGNLISSLMNYRKHLLFANIILESALKDNNEKEPLSKIIQKKDPYHECTNIKRQLELAEKELYYIKENLKEIFTSEKIKIN